jgi:uncharacterized protein YdeI (YjbR/CyaY-like superfamily)
VAGQQDLPTLEFPDQQSWADWLARNHSSANGVWLKIAKKGAPRATLTYAQALEEALCYGWIDGQKAAVDHTFWRQRFTPRGPRSRWSQINRDAAERLICARRMKPAGLDQINAARRDGRWESAYASQRTVVVPDDFRAALDQSPAASDFFATLGSAQRYSFLYRIDDAKRPETRARRIAEYVAMLAARRTLH